MEATGGDRASLHSERPTLRELSAMPGMEEHHSPSKEVETESALDHRVRMLTETSGETFTDSETLQHNKEPKLLCIS